MRIALYGKSADSEGIAYLKPLFERFSHHQISYMIYKPFYEVLRSQIDFGEDPVLFTSKDVLKDKADFLFSIGGDGTLLDTLTLVRDSGIPVMGINLGRMGFLSSISKKDIIPAIDAIVSGQYILDSRELLSLETSGNLFGELNFALNELTINKKDTSSMILIHVYVDERFLHAYWADGLIVSTPTGSTAYSLSCNGPIIAPDAANFVITPIATHNLTVRPVVIPDKSIIRIKVEGREKEYLVSLDSRSEVIHPETELLVRKANFRINLLQMKDQYFFRTIREKLSWGQDIRN
jgi:NAD+ kinase